MIDHIVWYAANLEQGIEDIEARLGVRATRGGTHIGLGTHNALLSLGERCYFEIIAPDPDQSSGAWRKSLLSANHAGLFHWAVAVQDLATLAGTTSSGWLRGQPVISATRASPVLGKLSWKLLMPSDHQCGALVPFLIDWGNSPHPSEALAPGCVLKSISVHSREKPRLDAFFSALNFAVDVHDDEDAHFSIALETPKGKAVLESIRPVPQGLSF